MWPQASVPGPRAPGPGPRVGAQGPRSGSRPWALGPGARAPGPGTGDLGPREVHRCQTLRFINIIGNKLTDAKPLLEALTRCPNMDAIWVRGNPWDSNSEARLRSSKSAKIVLDP